MITFKQELYFVKYINVKPLSEIKAYLNCDWQTLFCTMHELSLYIAESKKNRYVNELCNKGFSKSEIAKALRMEETEVGQILPKNYKEPKTSKLEKKAPEIKKDTWTYVLPKPQTPTIVKPAIEQKSQKKKVLSSKFYTNQQDAIINEQFGKVPLEELALTLGKTVKSVKWRAKILCKGFAKKNSCKH